jgi:NAD(P)-dependent dehydrogenase (short-subunit alcohol dehydrogenase family)
MFALTGKTALVTGGSGDIGYAIAEAYARAGAAIVLNGVTQRKLDAACERLSAQGARVVAINADVSKKSECERLAREAIAAFGRVDILVNCAGSNRRKPILDVTEDDFDAIMNIHARAAFFLSQAIAPHMIANGGGKIVHIGSITVRVGVSDVSVYGMAKAGLDQLTRVQAVEWAEHNIQVNCLCPGFIMTGLTRDGLWSNPSRSAWVLERTPMRRPGKPEEMTGAALLFASSASDFLTGQTLWVDGGFMAGSKWT